ncbi:MAG: hypothetical protein ACOCVC_07825, partial [Spirochaeta sp.]
QAARYDQLTSVDAIQRYASVNSIQDLKVYDKGHATILLDGEIYTDYAEFLHKKRPRIPVESATAARL